MCGYLGEEFKILIIVEFLVNFVGFLRLWREDIEVREVFKSVIVLGFLMVFCLCIVVFVECFRFGEFWMRGEFVVGM